MDGFFDVPAGYSDADIEMAELTALGNRHARRVRRFGENGLESLRAGETISQVCRVKATGETYTASVRMVDDDILYSVDGDTWHNSAREAREARKEPCPVCHDTHRAYAQFPPACQYPGDRYTYFVDGTPAF